MPRSCHSCNHISSSSCGSNETVQEEFQNHVGQAKGLLVRITFFEHFILSILLPSRNLFKGGADITEATSGGNDGPALASASSEDFVVVVVMCPLV